MQSLQIKRQTHQTPLARGGRFPSQRELAKAQHFLNNADHRLDRAFAQAINRFPQRGLELVGHFERGTRVVCGRLGQRGEAILPTRMMRIATRGNVGVDPTVLTRRNIRFAKVAC